MRTAVSLVLVSMLSLGACKSEQPPPERETGERQPAKPEPAKPDTSVSAELGAHASEPCR
ncbi:MAG TPA: hypothetical protein VM869_05710 [Enhygromyxa sp.]|nr:hypothetical protein [Enhygromyxa sp.]